jgi:hypothetical protein
MCDGKCQFEDQCVVNLGDPVCTAEMIEVEEAREAYRIKRIKKNAKGVRRGLQRLITSECLSDVACAIAQLEQLGMKTPENAWESLDTANRLDIPL